MERVVGTPWWTSTPQDEMLTSGVKIVTEFDTRTREFQYSHRILKTFVDLPEKFKDGEEDKYEGLTRG